MSTPASGTCLVTGGAGFIGTAASHALASAFERVVAIDNLLEQVHPDQCRPADLDERVDLRIADIRDPAAWDDLFADVSPDVVIHLAAETGTGQSLTESSRHTSVNVVGTSQMLDGMVRHGIRPKRLVLTSSRAVYGEGAWLGEEGKLVYPAQRTSQTVMGGQWDFAGCTPVAMNADVVEPRPVSVYGATKLTQEQVLGIWARSFGVDIAVLRLQNVYGPGQSPHNPYTGIMALFCRMAKAGRSIPLYEDGEVRRDFILIDDVVSAVVQAAVMQSNLTQPVDIGSGTYQTIGTAARLIAERYGAPEPHITGQFREGDVRHAWADTQAAQELLGWTPQFDLAAGVKQLADWIDAQELPDLA